MKRLGLSILLLASLVAFATAQSASGVTAYYSDFNLNNNNWNFTASGVFCAAALANTSLEWREEYGWAMYCCSSNDRNPGEAICGKCLKVTNTATGAQEKVRIFDTCGGDYLIMDFHTAFDPIDTDKEGYNKGHLTVDYEFVDCEDVPGESNVDVSWVDFDLEAKNWSASLIPAECKPSLGGKSYEWRKKYGWTEFGGHVGPKIPDACGLCVNVTNTKNKATRTARIVGACSAALQLDKKTIYEKIDDGSGSSVGHLTVDYKFVDCGDSEENIALVTSL